MVKEAPQDRLRAPLPADAALTSANQVRENLGTLDIRPKRGYGSFDGLIRKGTLVTLPDVFVHPF